MGLGAGFCLDNFIKDVTRTEYGKVQEFYFRNLLAHSGRLGGVPVSLILSKREDKAAVQGNLSVLDLCCRVDRTQILLDAGGRKQHQRGYYAKVCEYLFHRLLSYKCCVASRIVVIEMSVRVIDIGG